MLRGHAHDAYPCPCCMPKSIFFCLYWIFCMHCTFCRDLLSRPPLTQLENIGSVYPLYAYDSNRPLAPILRQRWCSLLYDVYWLAWWWLMFNGIKIPGIQFQYHKMNDEIGTIKLCRTKWSRCRDVVVEGHIIRLGNHWKGMGRGRSVYKQPGTRVDKDRTTQTGGIRSKWEGPGNKGSYQVVAPYA